MTSWRKQWMTHNDAFRSILSWYSSRSRGPRSSRKAWVTLLTYIPLSTLGANKLTSKEKKKIRRTRRSWEEEAEAVWLTIMPCCPTGPGIPTSPSSPWQQRCIFSNWKTHYTHTHTKTHAGQLLMGNINLLSHRSRLADPTGHPRLTLRQKKRQSRLNVNATKQGRVWNMDISILAFSAFAHRKLKLGQSYQSEEKNSDMDTSPLLFCQVWSLFAACVCVFSRACASGHCVWCRERDPVKAHARSSAQILELSAATRNYKASPVRCYPHKPPHQVFHAVFQDQPIYEAQPLCISAWHSSCTLR